MAVCRWMQDQPPKSFCWISFHGPAFFAIRWAALCRSWPTWLMRYIATSNGLVFVYFSTCTHSIGTIHVASGLAHIYMADRCLGRPLPCRMPASSDAMSFTLRICTPHLMSILSMCVYTYIYNIYIVANWNLEWRIVFQNFQWNT